MTYYTDAGRAKALDDVSFTLRAGEKLGMVGESGSGKSTLALAMMRMIKPPGRIEGGKVIVGDVDLMALTDEEMRRSRLSRIAYIPQGAMNSLNPVMRIGAQMVDAVRSHLPRESRSAMADRCAHALRSVDLDPSVFRMHPHELSGGMQQRVCIAIGVLLEPKVIIADEPTSALDVVTQRQVMETIDRVKDQINAAVILIGHDMGLMAQFVDRVAVMYSGRLVEVSTVREMFTDPNHPYARALINSLPNLDNKGVFQGIPGLAPSLLRLPSGCAFHPRCTEARARLLRNSPPRADARHRPPRHLPPLRSGGADVTALLELRDVSKTYSSGLLSAKSTVALRGVSLTLDEADPTILTVAGESGSGKTTLAMLLLGFIEPTTGQIIYRGRDITTLRGADRLAFRREVQAVFQDPFAVFNPFYTVDHLLTVPIRQFKLAKSRKDARARMDEALTAVGLRPEDVLGRFPHQLSGGQRQRINVARALLLKPRLLIADEPVSMVDASLARQHPRDLPQSPARPRRLDHLHHPRPHHRLPHREIHRRALPRLGDGGGRRRPGHQIAAAPLHAASRRTRSRGPISTSAGAPSASRSARPIPAPAAASSAPAACTRWTNAPSCPRSSRSNRTRPPPATSTRADPSSSPNSSPTSCPHERRNDEKRVN